MPSTAPPPDATSSRALHRIRVNGAGPVGLAFGLFLKRLLGARVSIDLAASAPPQSLRTRPLAISQGSRQLLERVIRFPAECAAIDQVDIAMANLPGRMRMTADELALPRLGNVVRYGHLWQSLWSQWSVVQPIGAASTGEIDLTVHAEGSREQTAPPSHQAAVLADLRAERPAAGIAFERFGADGPLALLPLPRSDAAHYTLVWCADSAESQRRYGLSAKQFDAELNQAFGAQLGRLTLAATRQFAVLYQDQRDPLFRDNEVWIGNAAQSLHPVAGQGLNLGLRDALELAAALAHADQRDQPLEQALPGYADFRRTDRRSMLAVTNGLATRLRAPLGRPIQALALALSDLSPTLRARLARGFVHGWPRS